MNDEQRYEEQCRAEAEEAYRAEAEQAEHEQYLESYGAMGLTAEKAAIELAQDVGNRSEQAREWAQVRLGIILKAIKGE